MYGAIRGLAQDLRSAWRSIRQSRGVAAVTVLTLGVGIGVSATLHGAARALVHEAVPFPEPERVVTVELRDPRGSGRGLPYADFWAWEAAAAPVVALGGITAGSHTVGDGSQAFRALGGRVSGGFFRVLGLQPLLGRTLGPADAAPGAEPVVMVTQRLWEERFGADPRIVGKPIRIDGQPRTVVGVVPRGMQFPAGADFWVPLDPAEGTASSRIGVIGRLRPGATVDEARAALATVQSGLDAERAADQRAGRPVVLSLADQQSRVARLALRLLQGVALVLLLVALTNAAGLMLTQAVRRRREIAVRLSLGASRGRIVRQLLVESTVLAVASGGLGLLVALAAIEALRSALPEWMTRHMLGWERFGVDAGTAAFALALSLATGVAFGIVPALRAARGDIVDQLREGAPAAGGGRSGSRLTRALLSGEVALAMTLLLTAGLLTRSLVAVQRTDPGFRAEGVLTAEFTLPPERFQGQDALTRFHDPLVERLSALPGVRSAGLVSSLPMSRTGGSRSYRVQGTDPAVEERSASWRPVTPEYLSTLGVPRLRGRFFTGADGADAPRVAVVSRALASLHWPGADPLGQRIVVEGEAWTVIGIAGDVHNFGVERPAEPTLYVPQAQAPSTSGFAAVRFVGDPAELARRVRQEVWGLHPDVALGEVRTLERLVRDFYTSERVTAALVSSLAGISLLITLVSLATLVAHSVAQRRREIGIRLALGAHPRRVVLGTLWQGAPWVALGIGVGVALAAGVGRVLASRLFGVSALDPVVFTLVPLAVLAVAILAGYVPARGAARVDPVRSLRAE